MQRLVTVVRNAGARNVLLVNGIGWAGDISAWAANRPNDPRDQLVAGWHIYNFSALHRSERAGPTRPMAASATRRRS